MQLEKDRSNKKQTSGEANARKQSRKDTAEARKRIAPLKKAYEVLEGKITKAKSRLPEIDKELSSSDIFTKDPDRAVKLGQERAELLRVIETLEMDWLEALESYEVARAQEGLG